MKLSRLMCDRHRFGKCKQDPVLKGQMDLDVDFGGLDGIWTMVKSSPNGIKGDPEDVKARQDEYGPNSFAKPKSKPFLMLWFEAFTDKTIIILCIAALVNIVLGAVFTEKDPGEEEGVPGWVEGLAILVTVLISTLVSSFNNWSQERQFRKLNEQQKNRDINVIRDGVPKKVSIFDLVVGDVIRLVTGDMLPCDGILFEATKLACEEAAMTGESNAIKKSPAGDCFMLCGCKVGEGEGKMVAVAVGMYSQFGILKSSLSKPRERTALQEKLGNVADVIGLFGLAVAIVTFLALMIRWCIDVATNEWHGYYITRLVDYLIVAITVIVVAVPEGLPLAVTIALAFSMGKMLKDKNLVRRLESCEIMGGATNICSDKTGTLTMNRMTVTAGYLFDNYYNYEQQAEEKQRAHPEVAKPAQPEEEDPDEDPVLRSQRPLVGEIQGVMKSLPAEPLNTLVESVVLNNSAEFVETTLDQSPEIAARRAKLAAKRGVPVAQTRISIGGNKTDAALVNWLVAMRSMDFYTGLRNRTKAQRMQEFPFSSELKRQVTVMDAGDHIQIHCKGAAEIVTAMCTSMVDQSGAVVPITPERTQKIQDTIKLMASQSLRCISVATRSVPKAEVPALIEACAARAEAVKAGPAAAAGGPAAAAARPAASAAPAPNLMPDGLFKIAPEENLTLLGIAGIKDPLRPEVPPAVAECQLAGITVRMVTGDNIETAKAIAKQCGIYKPERGDVALEGPVFRLMKEVELIRIAPNLRVLARSSPQDKLKLVRLLREKLGEVVAVTGDGTNDAPALSAANVGFAMGITGTEVAKDASAIVLTDDNFVGIVKAVLWGRNVYDSIRKFVQFQLTVNFVAVTVAFIGALFELTPLRAVQMLWVNMIMDTFAALALATDPPYEELLHRKPYGRNDTIICASMWRNILVQAVYQFTILMLLLFLRDSTGENMLMFPQIKAGSILHNTIMFNTFVFMQIGNMFCSRRAYNEVNFFSGIHRNWLYVAIWAFIVGLQVIIICVKEVGYVVRTAPLGGYEWLTCLCFGLFTIPLGFIQRLFKCPDPMDPEKRKKEDVEAAAKALARAERKRAAARGKWQNARTVFSFVAAVRKDALAPDAPPPREKFLSPSRLELLRASSAQASVAAPPPLAPVPSAPTLAPVASAGPAPAASVAQADAAPAPAPGATDAAAAPAPATATARPAVDASVDMTPAPSPSAASAPAISA